MKLWPLLAFWLMSLGTAFAAGPLTVYSSLDTRLAEPLLERFEQAHPEIDLRYEELQTLEIYERVIAESDAGAATADFVFSSAMDLQMKLANDGYAARLDLTAAHWPRWAQWNQTAFALTFEPAVIVYHKPSFVDHAPPKNRAELRDWLFDPAHFGRFATYDIERAGVGFLFFARDVEHNPAIWPLVSAMGQSGVKLYSKSAAILERVSNGSFDLGYNILGSYARDWAARDPNLGVVFPQDYTVVMSRIGFVPQAARAPQNGQLFLEFLMAEETQRMMAERLLIDPVHPVLPLSSLYENIEGGLRPIPLSHGLLAYLDQVKRARLIENWNDALKN